MPKITTDGPSYFPEGVNIRSTDDPRIVAVAKERGVKVVDPGDREPHEVLADGKRLAERQERDEQRQERDGDSRTVGSDDAKTVNAPDSGTKTGSASAGASKSSNDKSNKSNNKSEA